MSEQGPSRLQETASESREKMIEVCVKPMQDLTDSVDIASHAGAGIIQIPEGHKYYEMVKQAQEESRKFVIKIAKMDNRGVMRDKRTIYNVIPIQDSNNKMLSETRPAEYKPRGIHR